MKKNKINMEGALKQFDVLLPDSYKDVYKNALNICKDSANGVKNPCDAAFAFTKCFHANNPKFTFPQNTSM